MTTIDDKKTQNEAYEMLLYGQDLDIANMEAVGAATQDEETPSEQAPNVEEVEKNLADNVVKQ